MLKKKNKTGLSDDDFIESVIHKVRKYERRKKQRKVVISGVALAGVLLFAGLNFVTAPINTTDVKSFDVVTDDLLKLNGFGATLQNDFALNAGKPCELDMACENC